jgi:hypothetical protein
MEALVSVAVSAKFRASVARARGRIGVTNLRPAE